MAKNAKNLHRKTLLYRAIVLAPRYITIFLISEYKR